MVVLILVMAKDTVAIIVAIVFRNWWVGEDVVLKVHTTESWH
jgi:hypothetical protein